VTHSTFRFRYRWPGSPVELPNYASLWTQGEDGGSQLKRGWPNIQGWRRYELGKYNISFEEENGAVELRYVDCGKHLRIFFLSIGRVEKV